MKNNLLVEGGDRTSAAAPDNLEPLSDLRRGVSVNPGMDRELGYRSEYLNQIFRQVYRVDHIDEGRTVRDEYVVVDEFRPDLNEANTYAARCLETAFPYSDDTTDKSIERIILEDRARSVNTGLENAGTDEGRHKILSLEAHYDVRTVRDALGKMLNSSVFKHITRGKSAEELIGSSIEFNFQDVKGRAEIKQILSHYRSFVLATEMIEAAREGRAVDPELIKNLWQANNVRNLLHEDSVEK